MSGIYLEYTWYISEICIQLDSLVLVPRKWWNCHHQLELACTYHFQCWGHENITQNAVFIQHEYLKGIYQAYTKYIHIIRRRRSSKALKKTRLRGCPRDSCCWDLFCVGGGAQYMWRRAVGAQSTCCLGQQWMQQRRNQYPCRQCSKDMRDSGQAFYNIYHEYSGYTHALFQVYFVHMLIICLSYEVLDSNSTVWKVCKFLPRLSLTRQPRIRFSWAEVHSWPESGCIHNPSAKVW